MPSLLDILLSDQAAKAVCWTLVHSLWEGTLAALIAGGIIVFTRKRSATLRYNLLNAVIAGFIIMATVTFIIQLNSSTPQATHHDPITQSTVQKPVQYAPAQNAVRQIQPPDKRATRFSDVLQVISDYLNSNAAIVTLIWLSCFWIQLIRLSGGLYKIHRLRRDTSTPAEKDWLTQLTMLARQLGIKRPVALLQSKWVKTPSAIGFLKPAILVPLGLLAQLPAHQVETILLHELAHIRRNDYLANLVLHCTEAVFFFNPGIRWIASLIRREREACCDDIVLAGTTDRNNYFEALVAFTQLSIDNRLGNPRHAYMLQLGGNRKTDLLWRIKRMIGNENKKLHLLEKTILSVALFALVSFSLIKPRTATANPAPLNTWSGINKSPAKQAQPAAGKAPTFAGIDAPITANADAPVNAVPAIAAPPPVPPVPAPSPIASAHDTTTPRLEFYSLSQNTNRDDHSYVATGKADDGHTYYISKYNGNITDFQVDGKHIAKEEYHRFLEALVAFANAENNQVNGSFSPVDPNTSISVDSLQRLINSISTAHLVSPIAPIQPFIALKPVKPAKFSEPTEPFSAVSPIEPFNAVGPPMPAAAIPPIPPVEPGDPFVTSVPSDNTPHTESAPTLDNPVIWSPNPDPDLIQLATDLVKAHLITNVNKYSFKLTASLFIVNGVPVPGDIAQQFRKKYILGPDYDFEYSQYWTPKGSGSHCIVHTPTRSANLTNHY